ncbi:sulfotransferase [Phormidium nigroviride]
MTVPISIAMPVYNREPYIGSAIESVLAQTYPHFELLIWDDGSTDNSLTLARNYAQKDRRVRVLAAEHRGYGYSFMASIRETISPYFGCVDSDDLLAPTALAETAAILDTCPEIGLVYTDYLLIDSNDCVQGYGPLCRIPYSPEQLLVDPMVFHFRLIRRSVYDAVGGVDLNFEFAVDYELCLRLSEVTQIAKVSKPLYYYRLHEDNISKSHRSEQISASQQAIEAALTRRKLSFDLGLGVEITGQFRLRRKQISTAVSNTSIPVSVGNTDNLSSDREHPIFIIGAERSGTTLLRLMLTAHPAICIPPESIFFVALESKYGDADNLLSRIEEFLDDLYTNSFHRFSEWNLDRQLLRQNLLDCRNLCYSQAVSIVYQTYRQQFQPTASIWGDKNPFYIYQLGKIHRYFPGAKVVLIVRDFRACYSSVKQLVAGEKERGIVWPGLKTLHEMTHQWNQVVRVMSKSICQPEQFYVVYYEQLVAEPEMELLKICEWIGIEFSASMLEFHQKNAALGWVPANQMVWHPRTLEPLCTERIHAWQDELSFSELEAIELWNWKNLQKLGYKCVTF